MTPQHLSVEEADRDLPRRRVGELFVALELDPLHRCQRDPGRLVVLESAGVVDLDQKVRLVEIDVPRDPLDGLIVEKSDDYPSHFIPTVLTLM